MPGDVDLSTITLETLVAAIALVVTIAVWLVDRYFLRRRRLDWSSPSRTARSSAWT